MNVWFQGQIYKTFFIQMTSVSTYTPSITLPDFP